MNIGKRIAAVRASKGISLKDFKEKYGKDIQHIEYGHTMPKWDELLKICDILKISISDLTAEELIIRIKD